MEFTVVLFTDEDNAPAIIASNWMNQKRTKCFYPNVKSDLKKTKMLIGREPPSNDWLQSPIIVLEECADYKTAKWLLRIAENRSKFESDDECYNSRKRKKETMELPGEQSLNEEAKKDTQSTISELHPTPSHMISFETRPAISSGVLSNPTTTQDSVNQNSQECDSDIMEMKRTQKVMWLVLNEYMDCARRIESKLDLLLQKSEQQATQEISEKQTSFDILASLPVGINGFSALNKKISEDSSYRKNLVKILMTVGGRDVKAMTANLLRKLIVDDIGEHYSLTGKALKNGLAKQPFQTTDVYKLILEICLDNFPCEKSSVVREAVSDWLMQAKFRKGRREKRRLAAQAEASEDLQPQDSD